MIVPKLLLLGLLLVVLMWNNKKVAGCSCPLDEGDQRSDICRADFVSMVRIKDVREEKHQRIYTVLKQFHFKTTKAFKESKNNFGDVFLVQTRKTGAECGVQLGKVCRSIILSGRVNEEGEIKTNACAWIQDSSSLDKKTRKDLFSGVFFGKACNP